MEDINKILSEREKTHGKYTDTAEAYIAIKDAFETSWIPKLSPGCDSKCTHLADKLGGASNSERELTLDNIAMKLARILSGDSECIDHWRDIAGYATLMANHLQSEGQ